MKLPEIGPNFRMGFPKDPKLFHEMALSDEVNNIIRRANNEYWPWEDFKYKAKHPTITPEDLWSFLKLSRVRARKKLPFIDIRGKTFSYWLPDSTLEDLHQIDKSVGGGFLIEDKGILPEAKKQYLINSLMEEAIASSQIEGAATTRKVAKEMLRRNLRPRNRSDQMIINNYNTILTIKDTIDQPLSMDLLNRFHKMMTEKTLDDPNAAGRFRKEDEPIQVIDEGGQILHIPPAAKDLSDLVGKLCAFGNSQLGQEFIHPVVRAIILHFSLAYIHPYVDGNGRTARALFYWHMLRNEYWLFEYLSISRIILKSRTTYLRAFLHAERDDCDLTYFIFYHLRAIRLAIRELQSYIARKQAEYRKVVTLLKRAAWMNYRQQALIQHALRHPEFIYSVESHKNSHNITHQTARTDLLELAKRGYLESFKLGRKFQFAVPADLPRKAAKLKE